MTWQTLIPVRPVRLWPADPSQSRRASWLELFFDLIFVAAVAQIGLPLGEDYSLHGLVRYALMFLLIWWAWLGHTMYSTRFDTDDVVPPSAEAIPVELGYPNSSLLDHNSSRKGNEICHHRPPPLPKSEVPWVVALHYWLIASRKALPSWLPLLKARSKGIAW